MRPIRSVLPHRAARNLQRIPACLPHFFQARNIALENRRRIGKRFARPRDALFPNQMQSGIRRAVGVIADIVGFGAFKLKIGVKRRNLHHAFQIIIGYRRSGHSQHIVKQQKIAKQSRVHQ